MSYGLNFELAVSGRGSRLNTLSCRGWSLRNTIYKFYAHPMKKKLTSFITFFFK